MKVALLGDTHMGLKGDNQQVNEFFMKCYLEWFFPELAKRGITTVWQLGDLFDKRKSIDFFSLAASREYFFDELQERGIKLKSLLGNHDLFYKNTLALNSPSLLLTHYDNIEIVTSPKCIQGVDFIPWICSENMEEVQQYIKGSTSKYCIGHFELAGFPMYRGMTSEHGMSPDIFKKYKKVFSGHYHTRSSDKNIEYIGTPMEMTWNDFDDPRGFTVFDTETGETEFVRNPFTLFRKMFYNEDKDLPDVELAKDQYVRLIVEKRTDVKKYDKFIEKLNASGVIELKVIEDFSALDGENVSDAKLNVKDTSELITGYVDEAEIDGDVKEPLKALMQTLYTEALMME